MKYFHLHTIAQSILPFQRRVSGACDIYGDVSERNKHVRYMEVIAERTGRPLYAVLPVYEQVLSGLRPQALVTDYLPIMVSKRVRRLLGF